MGADMCLNYDKPKRRYATRGEAFAQARRVSLLCMDGQRRPYLCPGCGFWHVGRARRFSASLLPPSAAFAAAKLEPVAE